MQLMLIRHMWGVDQPLEQFCPTLADVGYEGLEILVDDIAATQPFADRYNLRLIAQVHTTGDSVAEHLSSFAIGVERAAEAGVMMVNCHAGRDAFSFAESQAFFAGALEIEQKAGIDVAFETHRGRILYNPWTTRDLLQQFDSLKLCADLSHWVCVGERIIDDQLDIIERVAERTIHLHARVGYDQGPQVPDPAAPEYRQFLEAHERWWDIIWQSQSDRGMNISTLEPEFGPPPYLHTTPHSNQPVADLTTICDWQARRQRDRFKAKFG